MRQRSSAHVECARLLREAGATARVDLPEGPASEHNSSFKLIQGASKGDLGSVIQLVEKQGTSVDASDYDRRSVLHLAAAEGHVNVAKYLLEAGANPNAEDRWGNRPLDDALHQQNSASHAECAKTLRAAGATARVDPVAEGDSDGSAFKLIQGASRGDLNSVMNIVEKKGTSVDAADYDKRSVLHLAAAEGHVEVVRYLLKAGANPNAEDRWCNRPLDDARRQGHSSCADLLLAAGGQAAAVTTSTSWLEVSSEDVALERQIGRGQFGDVYRAQWRGTAVACKVVRKAQLDDPVVLQDFKTEQALLTKLRHPNICMLMGYSTSADHRVMLISELMQCSLEDVLKTHAPVDAFNQGANSFPRQRAIVHAVQCAQGMAYLHTCRPPIIHRDLKPANLLLDFAGTLKVADFGMAKVLPEKTELNDAHVMTGECGSYRYMAPEVFTHQKYDTSCDVYSFAMIFYYMLKSEPPFPELDGEAAAGAAQTGQRPMCMSSWDAKAKLTPLLQECWAESPEARPSFSALLTPLNAYHLKAFRCSVEEGIAARARPSSASSSPCCSIL